MIRSKQVLSRPKSINLFTKEYNFGDFASLDLLSVTHVARAHACSSTVRALKPPNSQHYIFASTQLFWISSFTETATSSTFFTTIVVEATFVVALSLTLWALLPACPLAITTFARPTATRTELFFANHYQLVFFGYV